MSWCEWVGVILGTPKLFSSINTNVNIIMARPGQCMMVSWHGNTFHNSGPFVRGIHLGLPSWQRSGQCGAWSHTAITSGYTAITSGKSGYPHQRSASGQYSHSADVVTDHINKFPGYFLSVSKLHFFKSDSHLTLLSPPQMFQVENLCHFVHRNGTVVMLMKFSSLTTLEVVEKTTSSAASEKNSSQWRQFRFSVQRKLFPGRDRPANDRETFANLSIVLEHCLFDGHGTTYMSQDIIRVTFYTQPSQPSSPWWSGACLAQGHLQPSWWHHSLGACRILAMRLRNTLYM